jgi:hypothetical protein
MLREAVSSVEDYEFEMEDQLEKQTGTIPLPFPKMDKNKAALCEFYLNGVCSRGSHCPFRHMRGERTVVCKHWMRHLCKKGDDCEFLHEYEMSKMPVCYFFQRFGECTNKDCQYLHVDAETLKIRDCAWYDRGFCKHGRIPSPFSRTLSLSLLSFVILLIEICIVQVQVVGTGTLDVCCARITSVGSAPTDRNASTTSESPSAPCRACVGVGVPLSCCMLITHDSGREKGAHS